MGGRFYQSVSGGTGMNIFEDFYKKKITIEDFLSELSPISNVNQLREGLNKFNKKSPEEYLTQIFILK